ncbi:Gfo/Idh/MocA family protein [Aquisphaera insulae]|uniref:Gfo/Idh/MocA family protein n=1 Tax=Aquisphaera insulae TaxID=2712864 RepID=UPI0013ECD06F|nr:Gfo/Idh/MocA family oxidoreductase [Aquisphaera insulae]
MTGGITRRGFLSGSASAVAFPLVITGNALGGGGKAPASERVGLGHVGVGGQGGWLFHHFQHVKDAQSLAVADPFRDRRESRAQACKGKAYADFREILARDDIDAVIVATPDHWHVPIAVMAARAGKDCYVEKPLGLSVEQDLACRKVFQEHNRVFQYGTMQRSLEHCRLACEIVRSGLIGPIKSLEVLAPNGGTGGSTQPTAIPDGFDYESWLGPAPEKPYTVDRCKPQGTYWIYDQSIGYLGGWGAHPLDLLVWGCDADLAGPWTVEGTGKVPETGLYDTVYDWDMTFRFAGGVTLTFRPGMDSTRFVGEKGWVRVSRQDWDAEPKSLMATKPGSTSCKLMVSTNHYENFIEAVKKRSNPVSPLVDAVRSDILSHLCDIAVRLDRAVTWDPKKEEIVGDPEAASRLHRPMRSPWTI